MIFNYKDYDVLDRMLKCQGDLVNTLDENGIPLIKRIILNLLKALKTHANNDNRTDILYFYKIFNRIITDSKLRISEAEKNTYIGHIEDTVLKLCAKVDDEEKKGYITYFKNKIILDLQGKSFQDNTIESLDYEFGISKDFSLPILTEARRINIGHSDIKPAITTRRIYTFDHNPNEIDDGISVVRSEEGLLIAGVHIAYPLKYLSLDSPIMKEARNRVESLYFENGNRQPVCIPMLPNELAIDLMGLNEGKNVHAIGYYYYYDELSGSLVKKECKEETIRVFKKYDYDDFGYLIRYSKDDETIRNFRDMEKVSYFMSQTYNSDMIRGLIGSGSSSSRGINVVTNFMLSNGINMSKLAYERGIPFGFRNHVLDERKDSNNRIRNIVTDRKPVKSVYRLLDILDGICPTAKYSSTCLGHDALGSKWYGQLSSPLRRYLDNSNTMSIIEFIIRNDYTDDDIKRYREYICRVIEEVNAKKPFLRQYQEEHERRLVLKY